MPGEKVRVLVVDDSPLVRQLIVDGLRSDPDVEVVGVAENGQQAIERASALKPHVITMDVDMPVMDGLTATERIMAEDPRPILILTADPKNQAPALTHRALAVGALALRVKPAHEEMASLAREVKLLATIRVIRHVRGVKKVVSGSHASLPEVQQPFAASTIGVICIASSTGGPQVVQKLLASLPGDYPVPIAIVQHINAAFSDSLLGWLSESSKLKVRVAKEGDLLAAGQVLLAPPDAHLVISARGRVSLQKSGPRDGHLPSATSLLESAAKVYGRRAVGVILTGMGNDGVDGIAAIRAAGGKTIAQNQESSVVFGMPGAAVAKGVIDHQVHADDLPDFFLRLARGQDVSKS